MTESRPSDIFKPGDLLNNTYRIEEILGRGGTSEVYRARNEVSQRLIAIKALKSEFSDNEDYRTLMMREEEIREIRHDAVVRYSENHRTRDGVIYLVMDYVEGPPLEKIMQSGGMGADDLLKVVKRVAQGLQAAHARNIVHRDLSPDNIILKGGDPAQAVIIDFGIAKDTNPGAKTIVGNEFAGKYGYAAPEQLGGHSDRRTDLYSLGALILATFRGRKPDMGRNPMEVVQNKAKPLDTSGVPEPLKGIIDKLSDPIPDRRFQTADEVLAALEPGLEDRTVIVPRGTVRGAPAATAAAQPDIIVPKARAAAPAPRRSRGGLVALLLFLVIAAGGGAAFVTGALDPVIAAVTGPRLPKADPYLFSVEKPPGQVPAATGHAPSIEAREILERALLVQGGVADLELAVGEIGPTWAADLALILSELAFLDHYAMQVRGTEVTIEGTTGDTSVRQRIEQLFEAALPGGLSGKATIHLAPINVTAEMLNPVLAEFADCGPLETNAVPPQGFGTDATISVTGKLSSTEQRVGLFDALTALAGERKLDIRTEVLNPELCTVERELPAVPPGGITIRYGFGDRDGENTSGRYFVGENPVIDVVLPAGMTDGFLTVTILDSTGSVFHLLPNLNRPENAVAALRKGREGEVAIRVAKGNGEETEEPTLAFTVSPDSLGKSKILAIHSDAPLFDVMRPRTESIAGFAEAMKENDQSGTARVLSIDSRVLETAAK